MSRCPAHLVPASAFRKLLYLDAAHHVVLRPDISWWEGGRCVFVGDIKYQRVSASGILHPDLYQVLAYTIATDLPAGLLVYAAGEGEAATHIVRHAGKRLEVVALDLHGSAVDILRHVAHVAQRIRQHKSQTRNVRLTALAP